MVAWSVLVEKVYENPTTGLDLTRPWPWASTWRITVTKLTGLWATWLAIAAVYWAVRWYAEPRFAYYLFIMTIVSPFLFLNSVPYVLLVSRNMRAPRDELWHMGKFITGQWRVVDCEQLREHARCWLIRAFFLAFMISILPSWVAGVSGARSLTFFSIVPFAAWVVQVMFLADVCFGTIGYILTLRPLDSHIRSANPYLSAWIAALVCYPPFILLGTNGPLDYRVNTQAWSVWFQQYDIALIVWGAVLILLTGVYAWATVIFGFRSRIWAPPETGIFC